MIKQILPVPVLSENREIVLPQRKPEQARESKSVTRPDALAGSSALIQDSRGGQNLSDEDELDAWLVTLPRKVRFMLAMSISALSLEKGQCRSRDDLVCFLTAAGLPVSRQAIENIESRALRKCRRSELAAIAKEHLTRQ